MHKKRKFSKKAFVSYIAITFLFVCFFIVVAEIAFGPTVEKYTSLVNTVAIQTNNEEKEITFDNVKKKLATYPAYGSKYGSIKISAIDLDLPLYYGDNSDILSLGIGQYAGSYFPGEGGSIILAGHNNRGYFARLLEVKKDDKIEIETSYGTFEYVTDETKIVSEKDLSAFPVQDEKEMLILYTCYPLGIGKKTERFVVYAYKTGDSNA